MNKTLPAPTARPRSQIAVRGLAALALATLALTGGCDRSQDCKSSNACCNVPACHAPRLFAAFGENINVPDGLTQDAVGNIFLSAPNYVNPAQPAGIYRRDVKTGEWSLFTHALTHPDTKIGAPMGIELAPDGNLYYCDNQYFSDKNYKSRILRVVIENGKPVRIEPVITNIRLANAIRIRDNAIYFTDTFFDVPGKNLGGVYRVPFEAFKNAPVKIADKTNPADPFLLGTTETVVLPHRNDTAGADGMCFDADGNIYTGTFGSGRFYVLKRKPDGAYEKPALLLDDPKQLPCVDGICYYPKRNWVIITDSEKNAVHYWDIAAGKLATLWSNADTDGAGGLLDQPCEPLVWNAKKGGKDSLILVNFDYPFPGLVNQKHQAPHTLSILDLP